MNPTRTTLSCQQCGQIYRVVQKVNQHFFVKTAPNIDRYIALQNYRLFESKRLRCGRIFNAVLLLVVPVKTFRKSVNILRSYEATKFCGLLFMAHHVRATEFASLLTKSKPHCKSTRSTDSVWLDFDQQMQFRQCRALTNQLQFRRHYAVVVI